MKKKMKSVKQVSSIPSDNNILDPKFPIDRRPIAMIPNYSGRYSEVDSGQPSSIFNDGGVERMIEEYIIPYYEMGYRRIILHLPAGTPDRDRLMTSAQWGYLPDRRKEEYNTVMKDFIHAHPDLDMGVYGGFKIYPSDPNTGIMPEDGKDSVVPPDMRHKSHREWFAVNIGSYARLGFNWFVADAASSYADEATAISRMLESLGMKYCGEALPLRKESDNTLSIRQEDIDRIPWMCLHYYSEKNDPERKWKFDPKTTEVSCIVSGHSVNQFDFDVSEVGLTAKAEQGFVLGNMGRPTDDRAKIVFDVAQKYI